MCVRSDTECPLLGIYANKIITHVLKTHTLKDASRIVVYKSKKTECYVNALINIMMVAADGNLTQSQATPCDLH